MSCAQPKTVENKLRSRVPPFDAAQGRPNRPLTIAAISSGVPTEADCAAEEGEQ